MKASFSKEQRELLCKFFSHLAFKEKNPKVRKQWRRFVEKFMGEASYTPFKRTDAAIILTILTTMEQNKDKYQNKERVGQLLDMLPYFQTLLGVDVPEEAAPNAN